MAEISPFTLGLTLAAGFLAHKLHMYQQRPKLALPPSPKSYPFLGNLFSIPKAFEHLAYVKLGEQLGSKIFSLTVFGTTIVVLNDKDDATNLLEKRSSIYSDRIVPPMVSESSLFDWGNFAAMIGYGDRWRKYRRMMNNLLHKHAATAFHSSQQDDARRLIQTLFRKRNELDSSHELEAELYFSFASSLLRSIYGYEVNSVNDKCLVKMQEVNAFLTKAMAPSNFLVNTIPALVYIPEWFPGADWKRTTRIWRQDKEEIIGRMYTQAIGLNESHQQTIVSSLRSQALRLGLNDTEVGDYVQQVAVTLFSGGTETVTNTSLMFFMAMILFPDVQKKAQEELDEVLGDNRLPTIEDRDKLEYVGRVIQEVLRWAPVLLLAIPHACFQDDEYKGYRIPKGTIVIGNVWAMTRDPEVYKDPEIFNPDRFLDPSVPPPPTFGWGRRQCPGVHFGQATLFCTFASVLTVFHIAAALDEHGNEIKPTLKIANDFILRPEEFKFRLNPRSARHEDLLNAM